MNNTKKIILALTTCGLVFTMSACTKEKMADPAPATTVTTYTNGPVGAISTLKTGTIINQSNPAETTTGTLSIVKDANNYFVALNADFKSSFATGTVAEYLAKSNDNIDTQRGAAGSASNSKVLALGYVQKNGQQYIKIPDVTGQGTAFSLSNYSYVVFYCENAKVNFGNAPLQ